MDNIKFNKNSKILDVGTTPILEPHENIIFNQYKWKNNITGFESNKLGDFYYRIDENSELEFTMYYRLKNDSLFFCDRSFDSIKDEREILKFIRLN